MPTPGGSPARRRAPVVRAYVLWTLVGCAWFAGGARLWARDLDGLLLVGHHNDAMRQLELAGDNVDKARAEAVAARQRLDAFLSRHFDDQRKQPSPPPKPDEPTNVVQVRPNPERARLHSQLHDLRARHEELLGYLTDEHPEVVDVSERIDTVEARMATIADVTVEGDSAVRERSVDTEKRWAEYLGGLTQNREQAAAEYQQLYDDWQAAEQRLDDALATETAAAERLEATAPPKPQVAESASPAPGNTPLDNRQTGPSVAADAEPPREHVNESGDTAAATHLPPSEADSAGSQPLALAAMLIALAVAALAAVRLARSSADPTFASVDEAAAALAIPVVGIIPATAARLQRARMDGSRPRNLILVGQILLAGIVFAAVAYGVQNPGNLWRLCTHPLQALGSLLRSLGG